MNNLANAKLSFLLINILIFTLIFFLFLSYVTNWLIMWQSKLILVIIAISLFLLLIRGTNVVEYDSSGEVLIIKSFTFFYNIKSNHTGRNHCQYYNNDNISPEFPIKFKINILPILKIEHSYSNISSKTNKNRIDEKKIGSTKKIKEMPKIILHGCFERKKTYGL